MARNRDRPSCRWTRDTEVAFLLALRQSGNVAAACRAIDRSAHGANDRRRRLPEFAARWQAALDAHRDERRTAEAERRRASGEVAPDGSEGAMPNRGRYDGWTPLRQRAFLRVLAETGRYEEACRAVRISEAATRAMRRKYPEFQQACDRALSRSAATLEQVAYERAVEGWEEPIVHAGQIVGHRRRYSESLLRVLLAREAKAKAAAQEAAREAASRPPEVATREETDAAILRKLAEFASHDARVKREEMLAWADEMQRRGLAP